MEMSDLLKTVTANSLWQHTNGNRYVVLYITNTAYRHPNYPITVVYQNTDNGTVWSRPLADWERSFAQHKPGVPYEAS
jgi:hypothetical protein